LLPCFVRCFLSWIFWVLALFWVLFLLLYTAVSFPLMYNYTDHCQLVETQFQSINIISYHIISYHIISYHIISYHIISYHIISYHIISYSSLMFPVYCPPFLYNLSIWSHSVFIVFKTQQISHTDSHETQTEGQAYNSVRVYLLITAVNLAASIGTPGVIFCQCKVM